MNALLRKEMRLSASILSYLFITFAVMTLLPGYPILCGVFFITLGIFQSFQSTREANDIVFSALLPVAKRDIVKGKYQFSIFIELSGFLLMAILTIFRMTFRMMLPSLLFSFTCIIRPGESPVKTNPKLQSSAGIRHLAIGDGERGFFPSVRMTGGEVCSAGNLPA